VTANQPTNNPVQLVPAGGWRAVYLVYDDDSGIPQSWESHPLVAWALCEPWRWHPDTGKVLPQDDGSPERNSVHGLVVLDGHWVDVATTVPGFWRYMAPGDVDPTPDAFAAEKQRRRASKAKTKTSSAPAPAPPSGHA
jgi:hypothetical protein